MGQTAQDPRSDEQIAHERARGEVADVLANVEHALARAKRVTRRLGDTTEEHNTKLALADTRP